MHYFFILGFSAPSNGFILLALISPQNPKESGKFLSSNSVILVVCAMKIIKIFIIIQ